MSNDEHYKRPARCILATSEDEWGTRNVVFKLFDTQFRLKI